MIKPWQIDKIVEKLGITLNSEQREIIYCDSREIIVGGGERGGKSFVSALFLVTRFWQGDLFWIAAKDYARCEPEFTYVADFLQKLQAVLPDDIHTPRNGQWWMALKKGTGPDANKSTIIKTWSLDDWRKVGGEAPDGIIAAEAAQDARHEYTRLSDRTMEKRGWLFASGTFESSLGWYPELFKQYQLPNQAGVSFSLPTWSNLVIYPGGENNPEIIRKKENSPSLEHFMERFGGVPCPPSGIVFPEARNHTHVAGLEIVQDTQIGLAIDPGYAGAYAVEAVQISNDTIRVFDEVYVQGATTEEVIAICEHKWASWWKPDYGVVDIAAKQHQAMPAVIEVWQKKAGLRLRSNRVLEAEGRDRLHGFLRINPIDNRPRMLIDPKCLGLLSELGLAPNPFTHEAAPYRWKEDRAGNIIGTAPDDKNNHAIKALTYLIIDKFGHIDRRKRKKKQESPFALVEKV